VTTHELLFVEVHENASEFLCTCGHTGRSTRAFRGEDLNQKARGNFEQHRQYRKRQGNERQVRGRTRAPDISDPRVGLLDLIREDQERRLQMQESRSQTATRHKAAFTKGSTFPDKAFTRETAVRQTWVVRMIEAMAKHPGVWFEKITVLDEKGNPRAAKDQASTFNAAEGRAMGEAKKNEPSQVKFLRKHGGRFEAEYTPEPLVLNDDSFPVVVMRARYFPPESKDGQFS
jgi:hypothetical protein